MNANNYCRNTNHPSGHGGRHEHLGYDLGHPLENRLVAEVCPLSPLSSRATRVQVIRGGSRSGNVPVEVIAPH